jgi:thiol-disulfide isomerase/thioredoxin
MVIHATTFAQTTLKDKKTLHQQLLAEVLTEPAPHFSLKDQNGKQVSLGDFKGKVLVLDFWSTWCVPCKKSFPAMQLAQQKYTKDPSVKFLFIHTWETSKTATEEVKKYLASTGFDFQVLMDLKDTSGHNAMVESYQVSAIPAKFIIDKKGKIVFKLTGFTGSDEEAVAEISERIEIAKTH